MAEVSAFVRSGKAQLGLGLDGDADRFGIVDKDGTWLTPNQILALALYHLKKNRALDGRGGAHRADEPSGGCRGDVARRESSRDAGRIQIHRRVDGERSRSSWAAKSPAA